MTFLYRRSWTYLPRVIPYVKRHKGLAGSSVGLLVIAAGIALLEPWPLAVLVDSVLGTHRPPGFLTAIVGPSTGWLLVLVVLSGWLLAVLGSGVSVADNYVNTKLEQMLALDFRSDLYDHALRMPLGFHQDTPKGNVMGRMVFESHAMGAIPVSLPSVAQSLFTLVGMLVIAVGLDLPVALTSMVVIPFVYYSAKYYANHIEPQVRAVKGLEWKALTMIVDALGMLRVIYTFGRERHEWTRFRRQGEQAVKARISVTMRQTVFSLFITLVTASGTALVLGLGAMHVRQGRLTVGQLLVLMAYIGSVYAPLEAISSAFTQLQDSVIALQLAFEFLDSEPGIEDAPGAVAVERAGGGVAFEGVTFGYAARRNTLRDISFDIPPGQVVAVVGPTGAGKSTLVSLIPRLYEPKAGRVLLDGTDIRELTLSSLRRQISVVAQEPQLFTGTVRQNILYGRLDATEDELIEAAVAANADEFVQALPQGYDTELGEGGAKLSGGERQRICVARAFLKGAPILILDEPTSSIDSRTEAVILDALERLMVGRTTFLIAHRLSTIRRADLVLVLDGGRVVQRGTRKELLEADGLFRHLWNAQIGSDTAHGNGHVGVEAGPAGADGDGNAEDVSGERVP